jgi:hypothetical protein
LVASWLCTLAFEIGIKAGPFFCACAGFWTVGSIFIGVGIDVPNGLGAGEGCSIGLGGISGLGLGVGFGFSCVLGKVNLGTGNPHCRHFSDLVPLDLSTNWLPQDGQITMDIFVYPRVSLEALLIIS